MSEWDELADWWATEVEDPAYVHDVQAVLDALLIGAAGPSLDMGCGEGRVSATLPAPVVGCDSSGRLLDRARGRGVAVVQSHLPDLAWIRSASIATAVGCLVMEHLPDASELFVETARIVQPGGSLVVVSNHPAFTSSGSGPIVDQSDGEVLWRWGTYLVDSIAVEPAGEGSVVFHHRPLSSIVSLAARAGWSLTQMVEAGASPETIGRVPALAGQEHMPRLIGLRWRNDSSRLA